MNKNILKLTTSALACSFAIFGLASCGGSDGDLLIDGRLSDSRTAQVRTATGPAGFIISGLGDSDVTNDLGEFRLFGDSSNLPGQTLLTVVSPNGVTSDISLDTSGTPPFAVNLNANADGTIAGAISSDSGGSPPPSGSPSSPVPTAVPTAEPSPEPEPSAAPTPSPDDDDDGGFSENADCYCDDGFGPVAPSYTCRDTGRHPTDCTEP